MEKKRCGWCEGNVLYTKYHDQEWGVPTFNDKILFEFLILETFQVGLSWLTILKKRNNFKKSFDYFDYNKISNDISKYFISLETFMDEFTTIFFRQLEKK